MADAKHEYFASLAVYFLAIIIFWQNMNGMTELLPHFNLCTEFREIYHIYTLEKWTASYMYKKDVSLSSYIFFYVLVFFI